MWRRTSKLFVNCNFLVLLSTTVRSQNINKQNVNIADETLTDYSFLSRYHYSKSKNYLERRYRIRHWILMFIGTSCIYFISIVQSEPWGAKWKSSLFKIVIRNVAIWNFWWLISTNESINKLFLILFHSFWVSKYKDFLQKI